MSLYLTHRPVELSELIGAADIKTTIKQLLDQPPETRPHAFLINGPTGCGKTTIARIIAKELGSKKPDLVEMNSADFTGISSMRDVIRNIMYAPLNSPCRVYILDEAHRISKAAQDTLLKSLEDCPKFVYFILCTTEPKKLNKAVRGRCLDLVVKPLNRQRGKSLITRICGKENYDVSTKDIDYILDISHGLCRNIIQNLELLVNTPESKRTYDGSIDTDEKAPYFALVSALLYKKPWPVVSTLIAELDEEPEGFRITILAYLSKVLLSGKNEQAYKIMAAFRYEYTNNGKSDLIMSCYESVHN